MKGRPRVHKTEAERREARRARQGRVNELRRLRAAGNRKTPQRGFFYNEKAKDVPPSVISERDAAYFHPDVNANHTVLGDPLPGRSFLDRKRQKALRDAQLLP